MRSRCLPFIVVCVAILLACPVFAQPWTPPAAPEVPPVMSQTYAGDRDGDRIDDELNAIAAEAIKRSFRGMTDVEKRDARSVPAEMAEVELIFNEQITQEQIDTFEALGGQIEYMYRVVSYGWQGSIPLELVETLPSVMGNALVLVKGPKVLELDMDMATQTGRVRPIWQSGFAGNSLGFDGDPSITIGIIDSGVDGSHQDLTGRTADGSWKDFSDDNQPNPVDYLGHGSHVAGIAVGSGAAGGNNTSSLNYTYAVPSSEMQHIPYPIALPTDTGTFSSEARWEGATPGWLALVRYPQGDVDALELVQENSTDSSSPIELRYDVPREAGYLYCPVLLPLHDGDALSNTVIKSSVTNYPGVGDGFNKLRGVAPACRWAGAKVVRTGREVVDQVQVSLPYCRDWWVSRAIEYFIDNRRTHDIKVINMSLGNPYDGCGTLIIGQLDTAAKNGIVVVLAAGNDGDEEDHAHRSIRDFQYAAKAITVGASNDENALTTYSSLGLAAPADATEDYKPDLIAPGGSEYFTGILSVDSGTSDGYDRADLKANDYASMGGTSMASPFVAGCAALVIDAMQQKGIEWDFYSDKHPLFVKMVLCATATETGQPREDGEYEDALEPQRDARPLGFPSFPPGKDPYEGYGIINPDAAVEAVALAYTWGEEEYETFGANATDRRAWARSVQLAAGTSYSVRLETPVSGDFDLYLYSAAPSAAGTPIILASSTSETQGGYEQIDYAPSSDTDGILVAKRVSGQGRFTVKPTPSGVSEIPDPNLIGWWHLEMSLIDPYYCTPTEDSSGYGHHGQIHNGGQIGFVEGYEGSALWLNNQWWAVWHSPSYVEIPPIGLNSNTVTMTAWIKRQGDQNDWAGILFHRSDSQPCGIGFSGVVGQENCLQYHWNNDSVYLSNLVVPDDEWAFIALVVEPSRATLYCAMAPGSLPRRVGTLASSTTQSAHMKQEFDAPLCIGWDSCSADRYFRGVIDEVRLYNRSLSRAQIEYIWRPMFLN